MLVNDSTMDLNLFSISRAFRRILVVWPCGLLLSDGVTLIIAQSTFENGILDLRFATSIMGNQHSLRYIQATFNYLNSFQGLFLPPYCNRPNKNNTPSRPKTDCCTGVPAFYADNDEANALTM